MQTKLLGSVLMILGTCIGAGMLALPIALAHQPIGMGIFLLGLAWLVMTIGAFSLLEVNLWLPAKTNLISMSELTLGRIGKTSTWIIYLLLLYSLLCAYIAGSSDVLQTLLQIAHIQTPHWTATILAVLILSSVVYRGIASVDFINRGLMSIKFLAFILLILLIAPHIHWQYLTEGNSHFKISTFMVMITSFGYAIIVPSLRTYLNSDKNRLHRAIVIGSLLPLLIYIIWIVVVQGLIPKTGSQGLLQVAQTGKTVGLLMTTIAFYVKNNWISSISSVFISICAVTSFLGVSLCLVDFIADGLNLHPIEASRGEPREISTVRRFDFLTSLAHSTASCGECARFAVQTKPFYVYALTFLPPMIIVLIWQNIFIQALSYAGILCVLLLIILPLLMLYSGRHVKKISPKDHTWLSHVIILATIIFAVCVLVTVIV